MGKFSLVAAAGCLFLGQGPAVRAGDDQASRAVLDRAIKAQGGEKNLKKLRAAVIKATGKLDFMNDLKFTNETYTQYPDKFKNVVEVEINNMNLTVTQVYNGKDFWVEVMGKTIEFKDAKDLAAIKENLYLEKLSDLVSLKEKGIELSPLGDVQVDGQDAVGVQARSKGHRDLNLYFAKKTGLLLKTEARVFDLQSKQEVSQEKIFRNYKEFDGVMNPQQVIVYHDGKRYVTVELTGVTYVERHDDSVFAKP
jgi:hypothetical protein